MKRAVVIGAGFSGLASAYYLQKAGYDVVVREKEPEPGGLIKTVITPWGQAETAANGFLASFHLEELAKDIGLKLVCASPGSRKRFIFRSGPKRWPLSFAETLSLFFHFVFSRKRPLKGQTISKWGDRSLGVGGRRYLLSPALQGIYAGDPDRLSSTLILSRFFGRAKIKTRRGLLKGTVAPEKGMGEFICSLEKALKLRGVEFHYGRTISSLKPELATRIKDAEISGARHSSAPEEKIIYVLAAGAEGSASLLAPYSNLGIALGKVDLLPVVSVTAFFSAKEEGVINGFGCLLPRGEGFRVLGVLFNSDLFLNRSPHRSETWIFGGATDRDAVSLSDEDLLSLIASERPRIYLNEGARPASILGYRIQRWPRGIPHYSVEHEELLEEQKQSISDLEKKGIYLVGNYLGSLGLSQILERTREMVLRISGKLT